MLDQKTKVLIIEDEEILVNMYTARFKNEGFEVYQASNGKDGLNQAKTIKPNIILLDIIMPEMDGFMVLKDLKSNTETQNIPIIMLTNLGQDGDIEKGKQLGAKDYLVKANLTPMQVVKRVQEILKK